MHKQVTWAAMALVFTAQNYTIQSIKCRKLVYNFQKKNNKLEKLSLIRI